MKFGSAAAWEVLNLTTRTKSPMMTEGSSGRDMHPMLQMAKAEKIISTIVSDAPKIGSTVPG